MSDKTERFNVEQMKKDVAFSDVNLDDAMMNQASLYAYYATLAAQAQRTVDRLKIQVDIVESKTHDRITSELRDAGEKVVETAVAKMIQRDPDFVTAQVKLADAKMDAFVAKEALEAFKQRRDMLVQIGVRAREEMKGELRIAAATVEAERSANLRAAALGKIKGNEQ